MVKPLRIVHLNAVVETPAETALSEIALEFVTDTQFQIARGFVEAVP